MAVVQHDVAYSWRLWVMPDWARDYFERGYAQRWQLRAPSDQLRLEAADLSGLLQLSSRSRVVDIACGHGRYALALADRGLEVIGLDFATSLLDRAQQLAAGLHVRPRWIRGDMRRLPLQSHCVDATIVIDAFGFFEIEEEHAVVLQEAARILTAGGRLALKVVNGAPVLADFRDTAHEERDGTVISIARTLTFGPPRMTEIISISGHGGHGDYERRQRLYSVDELRAAVECAGLSVVSVFASADGAPFEPATSSAIWLIGQRS